MSDELYHYRVLGMRWGVRRKSKKSSSKSSKKRSRDKWSEDAKLANELRRKNVNHMSNAELRKYNERAQLEKSYQQLNPSKFKRGMAYVAGASALMATAATLYTNSSKLVEIGKTVIKKFPHLTVAV